MPFSTKAAPTTSRPATIRSRARLHRRLNSTSSTHHQREGEQPDEGDSPERVRPRENGLERPRDVLVVALGRRSDDRRQADHDRREKQEERVDRPAVPSARLGLGEQGEVPRALGRRSGTVLMHSGCHDGTSTAAAALRRTHLTYGGQTMPLTRRMTITSSGEVSAAQAQGSTTRPRHSAMKILGLNREDPLPVSQSGHLTLMTSSSVDRDRLDGVNIRAESSRRPSRPFSDEEFA